MYVATPLGTSYSLPIVKLLQATVEGLSTFCFAKKESNKKLPTTRNNYEQEQIEHSFVIQLKMIHTEKNIKAVNCKCIKIQNVYITKSRFIKVNKRVIEPIELETSFFINWVICL